MSKKRVTGNATQSLLKKIKQKSTAAYVIAMPECAGADFVLKEVVEAAVKYLSKS
jgi:4-hydroxy-3-methylbut-2-en-1-yl diphosphate synthase IspG/GcpE